MRKYHGKATELDVFNFLDLVTFFVYTTKGRTIEHLMEDLERMEELND